MVAEHEVDDGAGVVEERLIVVVVGALEDKVVVDMDVLEVVAKEVAEAVPDIVVRADEAVEDACEETGLV